MAVFSALHVNVAEVGKVCRAPFISVVSCNHDHHHLCCGCAPCNRIGVPHSPGPWWRIKDINPVPSSLPCNHQATSLSSSIKASSEAEQVLKGSLQHFWATVISFISSQRSLDNLELLSLLWNEQLNHNSSDQAQFHMVPWARYSQNMGSVSSRLDCIKTLCFSNSSKQANYKGLQRRSRKMKLVVEDGGGWPQREY